ncbi:LOW QUALITY PROTEIN: facilitated trehalose transporter Tret1 [Scaptodrosophila lebanonensis]|uniref:LOW QUALITY PROTEIN: facilitated trehalose transporter Tret1 n=1 Tax=Drosophila lebanonensis TaxID=7225 RepID=A0A6J2U9Q7_DROLE|nr:LOW QUALITY PROTEIN: facilitated trehalose transporter Tret1 [Scaptodrosophila lebanonensis]
MKLFPSNANSLLQVKTRYQLLATIIVNIITFGHGVGVGWLSPTLAKIQTPDQTPLAFQVGIDEISWLGSMLGLGSLCGNLTIALLLERMGRKFCLYLMAGPYACLWILIYFASNVGYLYAARFLCGFTGGAGYVVVPIFISEIADSKIRGSLTSMLMLSVNFGILVGYVMSTYLAYHLIPFLAILLPIAYFLANLLLPETAPYLLKRNNVTSADKSYQYYSNVQPAQTYSYKADFEELCIAIAKQQVLNNTALTWRDLVTKPALKAFAAATVLCLGYQFSGTFSFINYMSTIFAASGSVWDVNTCTIIIGVVQIVGVYTSTILVDIIGRRILMLISTLGLGLGCIAFGCFTYFAQRQDLTAFNWLPLVLMVLIIYLGNIGLIGLFFVVLVELFPVKIRSLATSISVVFLSVLVFCTLKLFPLLMHYAGISITMWFSAAASLVTFVYFLFYLPETKGKSMVQD